MTDVITQMARAAYNSRVGRLNLGPRLGRVVPFEDAPADLQEAEVRSMRAAIAAAIPAGFALVPIQPTEAMIAEGLRQRAECTDDGTMAGVCLPECLWQAMIRAHVQGLDDVVRVEVDVPPDTVLHITNFRETTFFLGDDDALGD